jgi:hypothetical protein
MGGGAWHQCRSGSSRHVNSLLIIIVSAYSVMKYCLRARRIRERARCSSTRRLAALISRTGHTSSQLHPSMSRKMRTAH